MDGTLVARVRRFNRVVTQRVGVLDERFLARDRPIGQSRVLWEIGDSGCDIRELRSRLDLDSGYLSRMLRSLEAAGLVTVDPHAEDKRVRTVHLTPAGAAERMVIDERSDAVAWSFLEPLGPAQRERLVTAMEDVERLLTAALVDVGAVDPALPVAQFCLRQYYSDLDGRFDSGFDPTESLPLDLDEMRPPGGIFLVATLRGEPVGCGALKFRPGVPAEIKRLWVAPETRGLGIGRRLLAALEARAAEAGSDVLRLDTNRSLTEAINLYRSAGYDEVERFNDEPYAHHWFEKRLT